MLAAIFLIAVTFVATNAFTPSTTSKNFELFSLNCVVYVDITHVTGKLVYHSQCFRVATESFLKLLMTALPPEINLSMIQSRIAFMRLSLMIKLKLPSLP